MIWEPIAQARDGPKLLLLDSYPLHEELKYLFSRHDTHVLYVPKGMTWSLQPLDCGFFKMYKDEIRKDWVLNQQYKEYLNEADKRKALSTILKEVFDTQYQRSHIAFWEKAGLSYSQGRVVEEGTERDAAED